MKVTPTSLSINQLFGTHNEQYVIPAYQRRYSWHERQVWELIDDISLIEGSDTHLLGSIVCLTESHSANLNKLELVDGQQRLTTIAIILECVRQRLEKEDVVEDAAEIRRLLSAKPLGGKSTRKVALDSIDAQEFESHLEIDEQAKFQNDQLSSAFSIIRGWIDGTPLDKLQAFVYRLVNQAVVIRLDVSDAKDAFKLFETINNRGLRLSPTDIIKNYLLGNAARFGPDSLKLGRQRWAELLLHLDRTNSDAFFRYYLMSLVKTRVTRGQVVAAFKELFMRQVKEAAKLPERHLYPDAEINEDDEDDEAAQRPIAEPISTNLKLIPFKEFLNQLVSGGKIYSELVLARTGSKRMNRYLRNLRMIKAVQTYGFLMHLRMGDCSDSDFRTILKLTEAFVLRRHVCRARANETEALFARLCSADPKRPLTQTREGYRALCPSDKNFEEEFATTSFLPNLADRARYCLERLEMLRHGEHDELQVLDGEDVHLEHIIPQKIKTKRSREEFGDWITYLGADAESRHPKFVNRIGNLTLFAGELNISASNNPFGMKKPAYAKSAIKLTKDLSKLNGFGFKNVEARSRELAKIAVTLWPEP